MRFFQNLLRIFDTPMETPTLYGWFHLLFFGLSIGAAILLTHIQKKTRSEKMPTRVVFITAVIVTVLEIYKQINFSFGYKNGVSFDYGWGSFPFQFCSTPMYVGLLAGLIKKGKVHDALAAYLATYAMFAGLCVMLYPGDVFISTVGINIQTMICHGSMLTVGIYLLASGHVQVAHKTILKALPVFCCCAAIAIVMNEIAYYTGLLKTDYFNMFYFSPHCDPHLPVFSMVQAAMNAPVLEIVIYIAGFTLAAYLILLTAIGIKKIAKQKSAVSRP